MSCRIRISGESFFRPGESLLHTGSGGASGPDAFLKENTDDRSLRIVEGMVIKRKRKRALFELPRPQKRRRLFFNLGKVWLTYRQQRRKWARRILKENADDRSLRIVEGIVVKRERTLFELPHPQKRRRLFSTWGKFAAHRQRRRKWARRIFEGEYG